MTPDLALLYPALLHNLMLGLFCMILVMSLVWKEKNHTLFKNKDIWVDLGLWTTLAALTLGFIFNGDNLFSGLVSKLILIVLMTFATGRLVLLFKKIK